MEREALRKINLIFGERIMKDGNAGNDVEFADGNMPVIAHDGNMPVIAHSGNMPVIAHDGNMPVIAGHLEVYALGDAPNGDNVEDL